MARNIMIQGTMSSAGKSLITAGLCRIFQQDGRKVAPFKSQNMALNSYITKDGLEMGRAQVVQAEAAGIEPNVNMNPILLKPTCDTGSQVIVLGEVLGNMGARDYFAYKKKLIPEIMRAYRTLEESVDVIIIEGAGSPAEINLKSDDIVNMGLAELVDAPVLLVADIDRGGVFAQLVGTIELLEPKERQRVKGLIINKFRGDKTILDPGIQMIEERLKIPVVGVVPYMNVSIDDEDSVTDRFNLSNEVELIEIAVIRYPRMSNFTDFNVFDSIVGVRVKYVHSVRELGTPDMIILPGSKNTMEDLKWMRETGLEAAIKKFERKDCIIFGICGGYQMLGTSIEDPVNAEIGGKIRGMELLPVRTVYSDKKRRTLVTGKIKNLNGELQELSDLELCGYEIHMGRSEITDCTDVVPLCEIIDSKAGKISLDGVASDHIYGTYIHGIFDGSNIAHKLVELLARKKGISLDECHTISYQEFKEQQYNILADTLRNSLDLDKIYQMIE